MPNRARGSVGLKGAVCVVDEPVKSIILNGVTLYVFRVITNRYSTSMISVY